MLTWLRIVVSCFCLVLCILFTALWVRSYYSGDMVRFMQGQGAVDVGDQLTATSGAGSILITYLDGPSDSRDWYLVYYPRVASWIGAKLTLGFAIVHQDIPRKGAYATGYFMPHWFVILIIGIFALVTKPKPRGKFSLRELFALLNVGAITLGGLAIALRAITR